MVEPYSALNGEAGIYHMQIEQYSRHGPLRGTIEASPEVLFDKEQTVLDARWRTLDDGQRADFVQTVRTLEGEILYTLRDGADGNVTVTDHRNHDYVSSVKNPVLSDTALTSIGFEAQQAALVNAGFKQNLSVNLRGREAAVFEMVAPLASQASPRSGSVRFPVYYDLDATRQRILLYVDIETGLVIKSDRYALQDAVPETLIHSFEFTILRQGG